MLPEFNTFYDKPVALEPHILDPIDTVERAGYIPLSMQIKASKESGILLKTTRALAYDTDKEISDFEKVETLTRDARDYTDMTEIFKRAEASKRALDALMAQNKNFSKEVKDD